jgi:hypothetical protein
VPRALPPLSALAGLWRRERLRWKQIGPGAREIGGCWAVGMADSWPDLPACRTGRDRVLLMGGRSIRRLCGCLTLALCVVFAGYGESGGSTSEPQAISRAVNAPLLDFLRGDANALCDDFTPAISAHLARGAVGSTCEKRVADALRRTPYSKGLSAKERSSYEKQSGWPVAISDVHQHGDHATAVTVLPNDHTVLWRLVKLVGKWRLATPATLEAEHDCQGGPGAYSCTYSAWFNYAPRS